MCDIRSPGTTHWAKQNILVTMGMWLSTVLGFKSIVLLSPHGREIQDLCDLGWPFSWGCGHLTVTWQFDLFVPPAWLKDNRCWGRCRPGRMGWPDVVISLYTVTFPNYKHVSLNSYSASHDNWWTVGGDGGCRVGEVQAGTTSPMPDHKGFKLQ